MRLVGRLRGIAVDRRRRRVDELLHTRITRGLVDIQGAAGIYLVGQPRVLHRRAEWEHGHVEDAVYPFSRSAHHLHVRNIAFDHRNAAALSSADEILGADDLVENDDLPRTALDEPIDDVRADEPRPARYKEALSGQLHGG